MFGVLAFIFGVLMLGATVIVPQQIERVAGTLKVRVDQIIATDSLPVVSLGSEGGVQELDNARHGEFIEMVDYRAEEIPRVYAAHNNRGGDILLPWQVGQQVRVDGSEVVHEVVEVRTIPKWSYLDQLVGMSGEFVLQTCYYGVNEMRFVALSPLTAIS